MITYCGYPIVLNTPEVDEVITRGVDLDTFKPYPHRETEVPPGFMKFNEYEPPPVKIGRFTWPTELNAWATAYYLVNDDQYGYMMGIKNALINGQYVEGGFGDTAARLVISDGAMVPDASGNNTSTENNFTCKMMIHSLHPIAQNAWLMALVDSRYYLQSVNYNTLPSPIDTRETTYAVDPITDLKAALDGLRAATGNDAFTTSGADTDTFPNTHYQYLYTPQFRNVWSGRGVIARRHRDDPDTISYDEPDPIGNGYLQDPVPGYSAIQFCMNFAEMLGFRIVCKPDAPISFATRTHLYRPDSASTRLDAEVLKWNTKRAIYGSPLDPDRIVYGDDYPIAYNLHGITTDFNYTNVSSEPSPGLLVDSIYPNGGAAAANRLTTYAGKVGCLIVDTDRLYSARFNPTWGGGTPSSVTSLFTQATADYRNWQRYNLIDMTYAGVCNFRLFGTVYELVIDHDNSDSRFQTRVVPFPRQDRFTVTEPPEKVRDFFLTPNSGVGYSSALVISDIPTYTPTIPPSTTTGTYGTRLWAIEAGRLSVAPDLPPNCKIKIRAVIGGSIKITNPATGPNLLQYAENTYRSDICYEKLFSLNCEDCTFDLDWVNTGADEIDRIYKLYDKSQTYIVEGYAALIRTVGNLPVKFDIDGPITTGGSLPDSFLEVKRMTLFNDTVLLPAATSQTFTGSVCMEVILDDNDFGIPDVGIFAGNYNNSHPFNDSNVVLVWWVKLTGMKNYYGQYSITNTVTVGCPGSSITTVTTTDYEGGVPVDTTINGPSISTSSLIAEYQRKITQHNILPVTPVTTDPGTWTPPAITYPPNPV